MLSLLALPLAVADTQTSVGPTGLPVIAGKCTGDVPLPGTGPNVGAACFNVVPGGRYALSVTDALGNPSSFDVRLNPGSASHYVGTYCGSATIVVPAGWSSIRLNVNDGGFTLSPSVTVTCPVAGAVSLTTASVSATYTVTRVG